MDDLIKSETPSEENSDRYNFILELARKVREDDDAREIWKQKNVTAHNQRSGVRKRTNNPGTYTGYKEVPIPITDKVIKKVKSLYVSVATFSKKQIAVTLEDGLPQPKDAKIKAQKIEKALNGLVRKRDFKWVKTISLFVDYFLENGHAVFKIIEKFISRDHQKTIKLTKEQIKELKKIPKKQLIERLALQEGMDPENKKDKKELESAYSQLKKGKEKITFQKRIHYSEPTIIPERGLRIIVPPGTTDLQRSPRITHDMWYTYKELKDKVESGVYHKSLLDGINEDQGTNDDSLSATAWDLSEGISRNEAHGKSELFNIRECQTYYKGERWVFAWLEEIGNSNKDNSQPTSIKVAQEVKFPYEHGMWTYVKHDNEIRNKRYYSSRGIPEQIRGLHYIMEKMFNARVIRDEYNNNPMYRVSRQLGLSSDQIQLRPGELIEAEQGEIEQINKAITTDISSERIEQQAKAYVEEYQSIIDFTSTSAVNTGGSRTATEINAVKGAAQQQLNTEIAIFLETLSEVAQHLFAIIKQSVIEPKVIGGVLLTPEDFEINATVSWVGSLEASDPNLQMQKALQRIQLLMQVALPNGIMTKENIYNAVKEYLDYDADVEDINLYITKPQEIQVDQAEDQMQEIIMMKSGFDPMVKPDDDHDVHIQILEQYINSPMGQQEVQANPMLFEAIQKHLNIHLEAERASKKGGNTNDPRRKRILQTFDNQQEAGS